MFRQDKIKSIIALLILTSIGVSYYFFGKEVAKYVVLIGFAAWLISMYSFNKK